MFTVSFDRFIFLFVWSLFKGLHVFLGVVVCVLPFIFYFCICGPVSVFAMCWWLMNIGYYVFFLIFVSYMFFSYTSVCLFWYIFFVLCLIYCWPFVFLGFLKCHLLPVVLVMLFDTSVGWFLTLLNCFCHCSMIHWQIPWANDLVPDPMFLVMLFDTSVSWFLTLLNWFCHCSLCLPVFTSWNRCSLYI